jgi:hypothetical protein
MDGFSDIEDESPKKKLYLIFFQYVTTEEIPYHRKVIENTTLSKLGYHLNCFSNVGIILSSSEKKKYKVFCVSYEHDNVFGAFLNIKYNYFTYTPSTANPGKIIELSLESNIISEVENTIELIIEHKRDIKSAYLMQILNFSIPLGSTCSSFELFKCCKPTGEWEKLKNTESDDKLAISVKTIEKTMFDNVIHGYPSEIICKLLQLTTGLLKDEKPQNLTIAELYLKITQLTDITRETQVIDM